MRVGPYRFFFYSQEGREHRDTLLGAWHDFFGATPEERAAWRLIGHGEGIHWPALDEDISVDALVAGRRSLESQASLKRWLSAHGAA
ncbi:MAG: DUF2442 domain-containing protein [Gemmatimonadaceae bacterium]|nr:DUF2442 domain-containing protein [Gemmatimonadaceae bacterium]